MSEVFYNRVFTPAELVDAGITVDILVPPALHTPWEIIAIPTDAGGNPVVALTLSRVVGGVAEQLVAPASLTDNIVNTFSRTELAAKLRVFLDPGATPPDGGLRLQLLGTRESSG